MAGPRFCGFWGFGVFAINRLEDIQVLGTEGWAFYVGFLPRIVGLMCGVGGGVGRKGGGG